MWESVEGPPVADPPAGCEQFLPTEQTGRATHLGAFTGTGTTCAFNVRVLDESPIPTPGEPPYFVADFTVEQTWTAANGDTLELAADDGVSCSA